MKRILVVDDDEGQRSIINSILSSEGFSVLEADGVDSAIDHLKSDIDIDVVLTDLKMRGRSGFEIVEMISSQHNAPEVIVMTAYGSTETAVRAMRLGAYDYLNKPLEREELIITVQRAAEKRQLRLEGFRLRNERTREAFEGLIAESSAMKQIVNTVKKVAPTDTTVLIRGESGTGKERIARLVHLLSLRSTYPIQSINCSALPETLLESELFGYEKGAFTGANAKHRGIIESAEGGTLFLDEVGDMSPALQAKLLRVLQEREIRPVGSNDTIKVDIRIIAATNRDLEKMVREGAFREDLFYRLNIIPITLPPLRSRREEIEILIKEYARRRGIRKQFTSDTLQILQKYSWPGNVRELEAVIERMFILSTGDMIDTIDIPQEIRVSQVSNYNSESTSNKFILPAEGINFEELEQSLITQALKNSNGVMVDAAKLLGMTYRTFQYRATKFGLLE